MSSSNLYTRIDLAEIIRDLGDNYDRFLTDNYAGCCQCGESVPQTVNKCPSCGKWIVWYNSKAWKLLFGSPDAFVRSLSVVKPTDRAGIRLCELARVGGFANQTEAARWADCLRQLGEAHLLDIIRYIAKQMQQKKARGGRGIVVFALNIAEKNVRERDLMVVKEPTSPRSSLDINEDTPLNIEL